MPCDLWIFSFIESINPVTIFIDEDVETPDNRCPKIERNPNQRICDQEMSHTVIELFHKLYDVHCLVEIVNFVSMETEILVSICCKALLKIYNFCPRIRIDVPGLTNIFTHWFDIITWTYCYWKVSILGFFNYSFHSWRSYTVLQWKHIGLSCSAAFLPTLDVKVFFFSRLPTLTAQMLTNSNLAWSLGHPLALSKHLLCLNNVWDN